MLVTKPTWRPESMAAAEDRACFFSMTTNSVNSRPGSAAAQEKFRKNRESTADMHWISFTRFVGSLKLADNAAEPLAVKDVVTEGTALIINGETS